MSDAPSPPGHLLTIDLLARLDDVGKEIDGQIDLLRSINDPELCPYINSLRDILDLGTRLLATNIGTPSPDVAEALSGLLSLTRSLKLPRRVPSSGDRSFDLDLLRGAQGRLVMAVSDALDAAGVLGLVPPEPALPGGTPLQVPRTANEDLLREIAEHLNRVTVQLDALDIVKDDTPVISAQAGLIQFYLGEMRVQVDLARHHLRVGESVVDFAALSRTTTLMAELTSDLFATIKAWARKVSARVSAAATTVNRTVLGVVREVRRAVYTIISRNRKAPGKTVFISHSSADRNNASLVCDYIERSGISCWFAPRDVMAGENYMGSIFSAIDASSVLLVLLSQNANSSIEMKEEVALASRRKKSKFFVRLDDVPLDDDWTFEASVHQVMNLFPHTQNRLEAIVSVLRESLDSRR
jgi:TIR domain